MPIRSADTLSAPRTDELTARAGALRKFSLAFRVFGILGVVGTLVGVALVVGEAVSGTRAGLMDAIQLCFGVLVSTVALYAAAAVLDLLQAMALVVRPRESDDADQLA